jgi:ABC-type antimicrobial peptide transport system permease subunit
MCTFKKKCLQKAMYTLCRIHLRLFTSSVTQIMWTISLQRWPNVGWWVLMTPHNMTQAQR